MCETDSSADYNKQVSLQCSVMERQKSSINDM